MIKYLLPLLLISLGIAAAWWERQEKPQTGQNQILRLYGNIDLREVDLAFTRSDRIAKVLAWDGDHVKRGQLLAQLDLERFQAQVKRLEALVTSQKAVVAKLEHGSRPQEIRIAKAKVSEAKAMETDAWLTYRRLSKLLPKKLVTPEEVDSAKAAAEAATARRLAAEAALDLAMEGPRQEDIEAAKARLAALQAQLALAEDALHDASLYAPSDGTIRNRILEPGDLAGPSRPVLTLALTDPVWARVYVPEPDLGKIRLGMTADILTDSFPDKRYAGWIGYISPTAEFTPKTVQAEKIRTHLVYQVRVYVCDPQGELRLGMPVTVEVPLDQSANSRACAQPIQRSPDRESP
ncbi:MAG TPA: HlyD family efflux transporter periplasmic adaptor subunit [Methylothermaceae bacterium]|nr:HlyD family efflux transporter periplasmic adaptor subunit [Methylothermaceae bacterium]